jgi:hypothetical protein
MTTVPIITGFLVAIGTAGSYDLELISTTQFWIQSILGLGLAALGAVLYNYFEN